MSFFLLNTFFSIKSSKLATNITTLTQLNNLYYNQIMELLTQKPEGMKACNISRHIYNSNCNLFDDIHKYNKIHSNVRRFLWQQSKQKNSPFQSVCGHWGHYAIKRSFAHQLELCFDNWEYDIIIEKQPELKAAEPNIPFQATLF